MILNGSPSVSLTYRLIIAKSIARSVIFLHTASFVHKNIRPETVLTTDSGAAYLVGFQRFRGATSNTYRTGDTLWQENLYRHPTRQGEAPEEVYTMQHDVYSLGVCLLEIGLWTSFVNYTTNMHHEDCIVPGLLDIATVLPISDVRKRAFEFKRMCTRLATERLPSRMGEMYTEVVLACLTCLDKDSSFADTAEEADEDGVAVGVHYISKVCPVCVLHAGLVAC